MRGCNVLLAVVLILMTPLGTRAADLVVWWEEGQAAEEDEAVREIIAAFEQGSEKQVELVLGSAEDLAADLVAALEAGRSTPDFVFTVVDPQPYEQWAYEGLGGIGSGSGLDLRVHPAAQRRETGGRRMTRRIPVIGGLPDGDGPDYEE